jgi:glutathione synthase/RimK-type ligase-like ATP-grasp enzyme
MRRIGFITSEEDPNLIDDDRLAFPELEKRGFQVSPIVWDHVDRVNELDFDALVFRSCWNYHRKFSQFLKWLSEIKKLSIPVLNPVSTIEWNLNKKHILELALKVAVPKTKFFVSGSPFSILNLENTADEWSVNLLVVKPAVSLNGHDTYLVNQGDFEKMGPVFAKLLKDRDLLIQEYIPEIKTAGETSLIFFNRKFSHAVVKRAAKNEFRVHSEYGGSRDRVEVSAHALEYSHRVLDQVKGELLYARVDLVETAKGPVLIELELVDPMLYHHTNEHAAGNFAEAIAESFR